MRSRVAYVAPPMRCAPSSNGAAAISPPPCYRPVCRRLSKGGLRSLDYPREAHGGVAQLAERYVRNVEVGGSNPLTSTRNSQVARCERWLRRFDLNALPIKCPSKG